MHRARRAVLAAFTLTWSLAVLALATPPPDLVRMAADVVPSVAWPTSPDLLIAEVVTGGGSASDEYVELTNAGATGVDLNGLELAYASSAGASATRRVGWTSAEILDPGRHLLIANAAGIYAPQADATYTAGIAATGGALVLRITGGAPIDAVAWGDATNAFVETRPAAAPPSGSSIERAPGGVGGNVIDTNDNAADWQVNASPVPENLGSPARPAPGTSPSPTPSPTPTIEPTPLPTATALPSPTGSPSAPVATPTPSSSPAPSPTPTAAPSATPTPTNPPTPGPTATPRPSVSASPILSPTPSPRPSASPTPVPSASPSLMPAPTPTPSSLPTTSPSPVASTISIAQALQQGGTVAIAGIVTAGPSLIDTSGRLIVVQDDTAAVEVRLPASTSKGLAGLGGRTVARGAHLVVTGSMGRAYGAPRLAATTLTWLGTASQPAPVRISAAPGAALEWRLVEAVGRLDTVHRDGQRWRADVVVGSTKIPVVGLSGAQILISRLFPGRKLTVIGILRRAYPTAQDQRFAIEPRSLADLSFARTDAASSTPSTSASGSRSSGTSSGGSAPTSSASDASSAPATDLRSLPSFVGRFAQVSGIVTRVAGSMVTIEDSTSSGRVELTGEAALFLDRVAVGDPLEVRGRVQVDAGGPFVLVTEAGDVRQAADLGVDIDPASASPDFAAGAATASAAPITAATFAATAARSSGGLLSSGPLEALLGAALVASLVLLTACSVVRRRRRSARLEAGQDVPHA